MKKIQSKGRALEQSQHYPTVLRCSMGANSIIGDGILTKFKLIQALIVVLLVCKNKEDAFKIESTRVVTTFLPLSVYGDFPDAQGQLTPQSKFPSEFMGVHVACKNEEDPIKSEGTGVVTTFLQLLVYGDFSRCSRADNS